MGPFRGILLARIWEMRSREEPFLAINHSQSLNVFQYNIDSQRAAHIFLHGSQSNVECLQVLAEASSWIWFVDHNESAIYRCAGRIESERLKGLKRGCHDPESFESIIAGFDVSGCTCAAVSHRQAPKRLALT